MICTPQMRLWCEIKGGKIEVIQDDVFDSNNVIKNYYCIYNEDRILYLALNNDSANNIKSKYNEIKEALVPKEFNFIVTPKEIDELIESMSNIVARGINMSV